MTDERLGSFQTLEERLAFERQMGQLEAEQRAMRVLAVIVEAAGGSVFVPDNIIVRSDLSDLFVVDEPMNNGRRYFTRPRGAER